MDSYVITVKAEVQATDDVQARALADLVGLAVCSEPYVRRAVVEPPVLAKLQEPRE